MSIPHAAGVNREFFDTHVLPVVKSVRVGRRILVSIRELDAWLPRYHGSVASWQNHRFGLGTAFVVELPARALDEAGVERYAHAVEEAAH